MGKNGVFKQVSIIGVGLIGGSIGLSIRARNLAERVQGVGRNAKNLHRAVELGAIDSYTTDLAIGVRDAELLIIAAPVSSIFRIIEEAAPHLKPGTIVTDVGSVKEEIVTFAESTLPKGVHFVGGHPMAGSEQTGVLAADRYLFEGAYYILTPTPKTNKKAFAEMHRFAESIGCRVVEMDPPAHDQAVAEVSHLPHLVACTLVNAVSNAPDAANALSLAAGGYRDTTRIAAGDPEMWTAIFSNNREKLLKTLDLFQKELLNVSALLSNSSDEEQALQQWLEKAKRQRQALPGKMKGFLHDLYEMVITISDQPGTIATVTNALATKNINIADIEILRVREGEGGTVRLAFSREEDRGKATLVLKELGITVIVIEN